MAKKTYIKIIKFLQKYYFIIGIIILFLFTLNIYRLKANVVEGFNFGASLTNARLPGESYEMERRDVDKYLRKQNEYKNIKENINKIVNFTGPYKPNGDLARDNCNKFLKQKSDAQSSPRLLIDAILGLEAAINEGSINSQVGNKYNFRGSSYPSYSLLWSLAYDNEALLKLTQYEITEFLPTIYKSFYPLVPIKLDPQEENGSYVPPQFQKNA